MKDKTSQAIALVGIALMMLASDGNALLFDEAIKEAVLKAIGIEPVASKKEKEESESLSPSDYVYGIRGLSDYLGVSPPTAQKYVNSGLLDGAIRRVGRKYSFLISKVDEAFAKRTD